LALLSSQRLSDKSYQIFNQITLNNLTASRLVRSDSDKSLQSVATLSDWVKAGSDITVTDDGSGAVTIAADVDLSGLEPAIAAGTTTQYWRGDKTWRTLPTGGSGGIVKAEDETARLALNTEEGDLVYQLDVNCLYVRITP